jgi:hypothetical protein
VRTLLSKAAVSDPNARMTPGDEVLLRMVELSVRAGDESAWDNLFEFAKNAPSQPYELVELLEARARAVAEGGAPERGRALLEEALDLAQRSAVSVAGRVARNLAHQTGDDTAVRLRETNRPGSRRESRDRSS